MERQLKNVKHMNALDGKVYGISNTVTMVNPYKCYFIAHYSGGKVIKGRNLFDTGWDELPDGIVKLQYKLSTGHLINIPKYRAYLHLVECSESLDGGRIFHSVNIKGMGDNSIINFKIVLKQDLYNKFKIGDIIVSKDDKFIQTSSWKFAGV